MGPRKNNFNFILIYFNSRKTDGAASILVCSLHVYHLAWCWSQLKPRSDSSFWVTQGTQVLMPSSAASQGTHQQKLGAKIRLEPTGPLMPSRNLPNSIATAGPSVCLGKINSKLQLKYNRSNTSEVKSKGILRVSLGLWKKQSNSRDLDGVDGIDLSAKFHLVRGGGVEFEHYMGKFCWVKFVMSGLPSQKCTTCSAGLQWRLAGINYLKRELCQVPDHLSQVLSGAWPQMPGEQCAPWDMPDTTRSSPPPTSCILF